MALLAVFGSSEAQVLITKDPNPGSPASSAILEIKDEETGVLFPRIPLLSATDNTTVPNPIYGVTVFDTNTDRLYFWDTNLTPNKWIRNFRVSDAEAILQTTTNYSNNSTTGVTINSWPSSPPSFAEDSSPAGWTDLNVNVTVSPTEAANDVFISAEGMVQMNNTSSTQYSFAIGLFVDNKLKVVRKFYYPDIASCAWKKFEVNGLFKDMPTGLHDVKIYAHNLKSTNNSRRLVYGNRAAMTCDNLNENMARIFVTAQLTE